MIFDLDGVIVSTDECHYQGWKRLAEEEGIPFDREWNDRLRGVSRMRSLEIILERASKSYSTEEREEMAKRKNGYYQELLNDITPADILPGVMPVLEELKRRVIKIAIGSSSRNTPLILERIGLSNYFDAVADGNEITESKPDPEVFLLAAKKLQAMPEDCTVVEDAPAGVEAAVRAGMKAVAVGAAKEDARAQLRAPGMAGLTADDLVEL